MNVLDNTAKKIRNKILEIHINNGGHIASSLSMVDILVSLYYTTFFNFNIENPYRDKFILSKGHGELALYSILADQNVIPKDWLTNHYRKGEFKLGGHPDIMTPGIEVTSGSLGHGLGLGAGMALAAKMNNKKSKYFVMLGDAECTEGSVWESALFASKHSLNNLIAIVDKNNIGSLDFTNNFTSIDPLDKKWKSFGWKCREVDGHNIDDLIKVLKKIKVSEINKPTVIIANTIKGKGISFIENDPTWHVRRVNTEEQINIARKELL